MANKENNNGNNNSTSSNTSGRGFASMSSEKQRAIASKGGKAAHEKGRAHEFTSEEARQAGRKGGLSVSKDRKHMSEIGKKGGVKVSQNRQHMAQIGKKGGEAGSQSRGSRASDASNQSENKESGSDNPEK